MCYVERENRDNIQCFNRGFDLLDSTTEIYSVQCTYIYLKFVFYHVIECESCDHPKLTDSFSGITSTSTVCPQLKAWAMNIL